MLLRIVLISIWVMLVEHLVYGDDFGNFFLKASKSVPRIGRRTKSNDSFENFFLKASKSVPRIGRRGGNVEDGGSQEAPNNIYEWVKVYPLNNRIQKRYIYDYDDSMWSDIADKFEFDPEMEIPAWPRAITDSYQRFKRFPENSNLNGQIYDENSVTSPLKQQTSILNKEITEYRLQPESKPMM